MEVAKQVRDAVAYFGHGLVERGLVYGAGLAVARNFADKLQGCGFYVFVGGARIVVI